MCLPNAWIHLFLINLADHPGATPVEIWHMRGWRIACIIYGFAALFRVDALSIFWPWRLRLQRICGWSPLSRGVKRAVTNRCSVDILENAAWNRAYGNATFIHVIWMTCMFNCSLFINGKSTTSKLEARRTILLWVFGSLVGCRIVGLSVQRDMI